MANGDPITMGSLNNKASAETELNVNITNLPAFKARNSSGGGFGLVGQSATGVQGIGSWIGVEGTSHGAYGMGVHGQNLQQEATGVLGESDPSSGTGVRGSGRTGVEGVGTFDGGIGVIGRVMESSYRAAPTSHAGVVGMGHFGVYALGEIGVAGAGSRGGVWGYSADDPLVGAGVVGETLHGLGVVAIADDVDGPNSGVALSVQGPAAFSTAGFATVPAGLSEVVIDVTGVYRGDVVLATVQGPVDPSPSSVYIVGAYALPGKIVLTINQPAARDAVVGYFVIRVGVFPFTVGGVFLATEPPEAGEVGGRLQGSSGGSADTMPRPESSARRAPRSRSEDS
jgi:hypothetical protein